MSATIFHHPSAEVKMIDPRELAAADAPFVKPRDPREQDVQAKHPPMRDDLCSVCGHVRDAHWAINGRYVGCDGARHYAAVQTTNPQRFNDPYPFVTCAVRDVLMRKCGPAVQGLLDTLTHDEVLAIAHTVAKAAVGAYLAEVAK